MTLKVNQRQVTYIGSPTLFSNKLILPYSTWLTTNNSQIQVRHVELGISYGTAQRIHEFDPRAQSPNNKVCLLSHKSLATHAPRLTVT